jgi:hypothetical protein
MAAIKRNSAILKNDAKSSVHIEGPASECVTTSGPIRIPSTSPANGGLVAICYFWLFSWLFSDCLRFISTAKVPSSSLTKGDPGPSRSCAIQVYPHEELRSRLPLTSIALSGASK